MSAQQHMILWRILMMIIPENKGAYNHKLHSGNLLTQTNSPCQHLELGSVQRTV